MCGSQNIWLKRFGNVVYVIKECVKYICNVRDNFISKTYIQLLKETNRIVLSSVFCLDFGDI